MVASVKLLLFAAIFIVISRNWESLEPFVSSLTWLWTWIGLLASSWMATQLLHNLLVRRVLRSCFLIPGAGKAVLVTGCDTGFGRMTALLLSDRGFHVFAGCLDAESTPAQELVNQSQGSISVLQLDVTSRKQVMAAFERVSATLEQRQLQLHAIVNNAGINVPGMIEFAADACVSDHALVLDVNVLGAIRVTRMFTPLLRRKDETSDHRPRIINISSQAARSPAIGQSAYCMSKAALSCFSECLAIELARFGIHVVLIEPFFYRTQEANVPTFLRHIRSAWNDAREEVKQAYGADCLRECQESNRFFATSDLAVSRNVIEVPRLIVEAVTSLSPDVLYVKVPLLPYCLLTILRSLPFEMNAAVNRQQLLVNRLLLKLFSGSSSRDRHEEAPAADEAGKEG